MSAPEQRRGVADAGELPSVPERVFTRHRRLLDLSGPQWRIPIAVDGGGELMINWDLLSEAAARGGWRASATHIVRLYAADRLQRRDPSTVVNDVGMFLRFARWLPTVRRGPPFEWGALDVWTGREFLRHGETETSNGGNDFSRLRSFYRWGLARELPGFTPGKLSRLKSLTARGNAKGHHVRSRHPTKGPISPDERFLIARAIAAEGGRETDRATVMLCLELGRNPLAMTRLQNRDLVRFDTAVETFYQLDIPRIKKRVTTRQTKRYPISNLLGDLLTNLRIGAPDAPLLYWLRGCQNPSEAVNRSLRRWIQASDLRSPSTGQPLNVHARRFRSGLATQMAEEGASLVQIAEALDHSDLQNVDVYRQATSSIADAVAVATDPALGPLIDRFLGRILSPGEHPPQHAGRIPGTVLHLPVIQMDTGGVGYCGRDVRADGLCNLFPPLSCYLCPQFLALPEAPHRVMRANLDAALKEMGPEADPRILRQLDDVRLAIDTVIARIEGSSPQEASV